MVEFGNLENVDLRTAWPHEANDFTPWLAENLERLSQVIGIPMEAEDTEVAVGQFAADILARNPQDNSLVLIENQLEWTDHTHLGQILTYLAGLDAKTIIWVAKEFTNPHLSAIGWLNEHTVEPFSFFAVRVKVVQIGESPLVPIFEVLERPNEWDRQIRAQHESSGELTGYSKLRHDFWAEYAKRYPEDGQIRSSYKGANVYRRIEGLIVSQYMMALRGVGIYLRESSRGYTEGDRRLAQRCTTALVEGGVIQETWGTFKEIDSQDPNNWPEMAQWLHERLSEYREVIESLASDPEPNPTES